MEISQHIKNLLITNERVILNGFGAFDSKHIPARIDKETKTMTPPFKIVVFNPEYKEDEGLLAKHMAEKEDISFDNANEQISEYVKTIKTKLDSGEKVSFQDLGEFTKSADGNYEFSYMSEDNLLVDSFGLPKVSITEQDKLSAPPPKKDLRKAPIKTGQDKPKPIPAKPKAKPIPAKPIRKQPVKKAAPVKKSKPVKLKKEDTKKKKRFWPVLLILIGLIGILLVAVYFFKPDLWKKGYSFSSEKIAYVKKSVFGDNKDKLEIITPDDEIDQTEEIADNSVDTSDSQVADVTDTTSTEEIADNQTEEVSGDNQTTDVQKEDNQDVVEDNTREVQVNTNSGSAQNGKYYIIIGSVKSEASAQKEQKRYAKKGITTNILYAKKMNRYRMSIGEFSSAKAAQDFFTDFQNKHGNIDAWVWEKR